MEGIKVQGLSKQPCVICEKEIISGNAYLVNCVDLPNKPHGNNCDCSLPVGDVCYKKFKDKNSESGK